MMIKDIVSVRDFYTTYCPTEKRAIEIVAEQRWKGKKTCPYCAKGKVCVCSDSRYKCNRCNRKFSVKTGTFMQGSKIPVQQWLYVIYVLKINPKGISSIKLSKELGITQKSAWYMAQKIRTCLIERPTLSGVIEMDETFIGGKEGNKHASKKLHVHGTEGKVAVMGAIERNSKQVVAVPVREVNTSTVGTFINTFTDKHSDIMADECRAYDKHTWLRVNHSKGEYVDKEMPEIHTNSIESYWAVIKRGQMGVYHWWSKKHLLRYMREYSYRFNRREQSNIGFINDVVRNGIGRMRTFKQITQ